MANENDGDKLVIEIELDDGKLAKGFINAKNIASSEGEKSGQNFGEGAYKGASATLGKLKSLIGGLGAGLLAGFTLKEMIGESLEGQAAIAKLNNSLRTSGEYTPALSQEIQDLAGHISNLTGASGESILEQFALSKSLGATADQAKKITQAAQGFANALGVDVTSAVLKITTTLNGQAGALARVVPELKNLTEEQLRAGAAIDIINDKFKLFAGDRINTFSGSFDFMRNGFNDILKYLGDLITKTPAVIAIFRVIGEELGKAGEKLKAFATQENLKIFSSQIIETGRIINAFLIQPLEILYNTGKLVFELLRTGLQTIVAGFAGLLGKMADMANFFGVDNEFTRGLQDFADSTASVLGDVANSTGEAFNNLFDTSFTDRADEFLNRIETVTAQVAEANAQAVQNTVQTQAQAKTVIAKDAKEIANMIQNGLVRSVSTGIAAVGASFVLGGKAFSDFGNSIIGIMGDLAIQVGTAIIFTGEAIEVLRTSIATAVGIPAIAMGIALIALGGALKAFASKGAATASASSAAPQTGGPSFGSNPIDNTTFNQPETQRERDPVVNVNIQGDILDSQETGRRIVGILNEAFDKEGMKLRRGAVL